MCNRLHSASLVSASIIVAIAFRFLDSPKERVMRQNMATMEERIRLVQDQLRSMSNELEQLEQRDNDVYRSIFETAPLPDSIRLGRSARELETDDYAYRETDDLLAQLTLQLDNLKHRLKMQR